MREATVLFKGEKAGILTQHDDASFTFAYLDDWVLNIEKPSISLILQKKIKCFTLLFCFLFFIICFQKELINRQYVNQIKLT